MMISSLLSSPDLLYTRYSWLDNRSRYQAGWIGSPIKRGGENFDASTYTHYQSFLFILIMPWRVEAFVMQSAHVFGLLVLPLQGNYIDRDSKPIEPSIQIWELHIPITHQMNCIYVCENLCYLTVWTAYAVQLKRKLRTVLVIVQKFKLTSVQYLKK